MNEMKSSWQDNCFPNLIEEKVITSSVLGMNSHDNCMAFSIQTFFVRFSVHFTSNVGRSIKSIPVFYFEKLKKMTLSNTLLML